MRNPITGPLSVTNPVEAKRALRAYRIRRVRVLILGVLVLVLLGMLFVQGSLNILPILVPDTPSQTMVLYGLSALNFIASTILLTLLVRNLLKLQRDRKQGTLGSKFQNRLVAASLLISALPLLMLFLFAYGLINRSLDKWFNLPADRYQQDAEVIGKMVVAREQGSLASAAEFLRRRVEERKGPSEIAPELPSLGIERLVVLEPDGGRRFSLGNQEIEPKVYERVKKGLLEGKMVEETFRNGDREFFFIGVPFTNGPGGVMALKGMPGTLADKIEAITQNGRDRAQLTNELRGIKRNYLYILGFITVLLMFGATWIALNVARGVTLPILALAEATDAVAKGDLDHYVSVRAEDELAVLVDSFNEMARQLRVSRGQLEERRRYIETILQSLFTGIISLDSENRVTTFNRTASEMLGMPLEPRTLLTERVPVVNVQDFQRVLRRTRRTGQSTVEVELRVPTRENFHIAITGTALRDNDGRFSGTVLMMEDLSPLIQAQRSAVWSEVARRMAHEIKNPLTPIQLSAERIQRNVARSGLASPKLMDTVAECTSIIEQEVGTLQRMVDEFSRFAKLPDARPEAVSLNEIVEKTVVLYAERLGDIRLETRLDPNLPNLTLDSEQMKRCLVNLIDNAFHAIGEDSEAFVPSGTIAVSTGFDPDGEVAWLRVADTGSGIPPNARDRLFEPYFSTRERGTGLGLAIVSHIVADHHGRIRYEPNSPRGAVFILEFPVAEATVSANLHDDPNSQAA
jgi:PAS domain S-box-containing protein